VTIYHVARAIRSDEKKQKFLTGIDNILHPVFDSKGMDWKYFIVEASRDLWKVNGLMAP
jgi:hypothetical protein